MRDMEFARRTVLKAMGVGAMIHLTGGLGEGAVYELRVYHCATGRLPDVLKRFREHTVGIFGRLGMTSVAYWVPTDEPAHANTLVYILKFPSRAAAEASWTAFRVDPEWLKVKAASEANGPIVERLESTFMDLTDFSAKV
jgi:hypothetical protein